MTDGTLEKFIARILEMQTNGLLISQKESDLKSVANELGINEEEWLQIQHQASSQLVQAKGFMSYQNYDDAINQLSQAQLIQPYNTEIVFSLAFCNYQKWLSTQSSHYADAALNFAQLCLQVEPTNSEAIKLISQIRLYGIKKAKTRKTAIVIGLVVIALIALTFVLKTKTGQPKVEPSATQPMLENPVQTENTTNSGQAEVQPSFIPNNIGTGLTFIQDNSVFGDYGTSYSYNLKGFFEVKGYEYEVIEMKTVLIGTDGKPVASNISKILDNYQPIARPGDQIPFGILIFEKQKMPVIKKIEISIISSSKTASTVTYEKSKKIEHNWAIEKPANYDIEVYERFSQVSAGFDNSSYQKLELEVKNTGKKPIKTLRARIDWYDKNNRAVGSSTLYLSNTELPRLLVGKTRVEGGTYEIKGCTRDQYKSYTVNIIEID